MKAPASSAGASLSACNVGYGTTCPVRSRSDFWSQPILGWSHELPRSASSDDANRSVHRVAPLPTTFGLRDRLRPRNARRREALVALELIDVRLGEREARRPHEFG